MIGSQTRTLVRERAQNACEHCHLHQDDSPLAALHVEHIIPKIHGGADDLDNLEVFWKAGRRATATASYRGGEVISKREQFLVRARNL